MSSDSLRPRSEPLDTGFERFVAAASPGLLRSAYLLTGDRGHAEDLLQDALIRTLNRWDAITGSPAVYAGMVLINLSHDRRRAARRRPATAAQELASDRSANDQITTVVERDAIVRAARRLPARQREVLACRFLLDLSVAETSATLGVPDGTVKSYTARALKRMRELLENPAAGVPDERTEVRDAQ